MGSVPVPIRRRSAVIISTEVDNRDQFPATSRYKAARYFQRSIPGLGKFIEQESWIPPDIEKSDDDLFTKVNPGEEDRLDLVALRVYGLSQLWWLIAFFNDIIDPFEGTPSGRILRYPPFDVVSTRILT